MVGLSRPLPRELGWGCWWEASWPQVPEMHFKGIREDGMSVDLSLLVGHSAKENSLFMPVCSLDSQHSTGKCKALGQLPVTWGLKD